MGVGPGRGEGGALWSEEGQRCGRGSTMTSMRRGARPSNGVKFAITRARSAPGRGVRRSRLQTFPRGAGGGRRSDGRATRSTCGPSAAARMAESGRHGRTRRATRWLERACEPFGSSHPPASDCTLPSPTRPDRRTHALAQLWRRPCHGRALHPPRMLHRSPPPLTLGCGDACSGARLSRCRCGARPCATARRLGRTRRHCNRH